MSSPIWVAQLKPFMKKVEEVEMHLPKFKEWQILTKILTISIVSVTFMSLGILFFFMPLVEQKMLQEKSEGLQNVVDIAYGAFHEYGNLAQKGEISSDEAKKQFIHRIKNLRYNEHNYFWINDINARMVVHPIKPELDGVDLSGNKDPKGKYLFREFIAVAKNQGSGFVDYMWPKTGRQNILRKTI